MICTVTLNPAIDYVLFADELKKGAVNRAFRSRLRPGGKGINISLVLKSFGLPSLAAGFAAGATGGMLRAMLAEAGIRTDLLEAEGMTRINVKIRAREETDVNALGPSVREEAFSELCRRVSRLPAGGVLVLAGSAPPSLHADAYARLACAVSEEVRVAVDASGELLRASLACSPWLVKPNREELGELFGVRIGGQEEALFYARKLQGEGARNVIVSLGAQGAVMAAEDGEPCSATLHCVPFVLAASSSAGTAGAYSSFISPLSCHGRAAFAVPFVYIHYIRFLENSKSFPKKYRKEKSLRRQKRRGHGSETLRYPGYFFDMKKIFKKLLKSYIKSLY